MNVKELSNAQKMILFGQIATLFGGMLISLGTLLSLSEPPSEPMFGTLGNGSNNLGGHNSAQSYFTGRDFI